MSFPLLSLDSRDSPSVVVIFATRASRIRKGSPNKLNNWCCMYLEIMMDLFSIQTSRLSTTWGNP